MTGETRGGYRWGRRARRRFPPHCGGLLEVLNADAGLHVAALLAKGLDDRTVVRHMVGRELTATALSTCYARPAARSGLLLGFGGSSERRILAATRVLGEVLRDI